MVLGLGIWGMVAWVIPPMLNLGSSGDPASVARAASAAASTPVETVDMAMLRAAVQKAVDALQVAGSVRTLPYAAGKVQLSGVVDSDETAEAVVRAASKVTTSLKMSLLSQAEFALRLQGLKSALPEELTLRALPWGKVEVSGTVPDQATKENVQSLLLEELPMAVAVDMKVLTTQERQAQEARTAAASTPKLPPVAAVISGPRPYLVLADGRKILPGGVVGQLRLAGIEPQAVVFENEAGVQYRMAR
jgi:type III secretion protein D